VDTQRILDQAETVDNHGNRVGKLKEILLAQMGIETEELYARREFRWRGTTRLCEVIINNVRELPDETLEPTGEGWRIIIDYPFDALNHSSQEDLARLQRFREAGKGGRVICWLPSFLNRKTQQDLGLVVRLDYILKENRFPTFVTHLSEVDRAAARAQLENQRGILHTQLLAQLEMAYGLRSGGAEYLDPANRIELAEQFQSMLPSLVLQPPVASNFREGLEGLLSQALDSQFPAHPKFEEDTQLTKGTLGRVLDVVRAASRDPNGVTHVDQADRKHMLRIAVPLKLGEMGENRFQIGHYWKQHFAKRIAQHGPAAQPLTVKRLREWINDPAPMGLLEPVQDLVVLTFAEQTDRYLTLHGTPVDGAIGGLHDEAVLRETELPTTEAWNVARERGKAIFGVDSSPLLNAGNLVSLATSVRAVLDQHRAAVRALPGSIQRVKAQVWPELTANTRLDTAVEVDGLVSQLEQARSEVDAVKQLAGMQLKAKPAVLGASLKSAAGVANALDGQDWQTLLVGTRALADARKAEADRMWHELEESFTSDELGVALAPKLAALQKQAVQLLTRVPAPPPEPPPTSPPPPIPPEPPARTAPGEQLKRLYGRSQAEGDDLPEWVPGDLRLELLQVHYITPPSQGGRDERSNMIVVTPTLRAVIQMDAQATVDLLKGELHLPRFQRRLKLSVSPEHNG
jgi:hypothetical protein